MHLNMRRVRPGVKEGFRLDSNHFVVFCFCFCVGVSSVGVIKETPDIILSDLFMSVTNLLPFKHQRKTAETCGLTCYGSGRGMDVVVHQCFGGFVRACD